MSQSMTHDEHRSKEPGDLDRWTRLVFAVLERLAVGRLTLVLPDRRVFTFHGREPGPTPRSRSTTRRRFASS